MNFFSILISHFAACWCCRMTTFPCSCQILPYAGGVKWTAFPCSILILHDTWRVRCGMYISNLPQVWTSGHSSCVLGSSKLLAASVISTVAAWACFYNELNPFFIHTLSWWERWFKGTYPKSGFIWLNRSFSVSGLNKRQPKSWFTIVNYEVPWSTMKYHGQPWTSMLVRHFDHVLLNGTVDFTMVVHGRSW